MNLDPRTWFKSDPPSSPFKVGDLCRVVPKCEKDQKFAGLECTILSPLNLVPWNDGGQRWAHQIELQGHLQHPLVHAQPCVLRKLPPPETKLENWDECPFKPVSNPVDETQEALSAETTP